MKFEENANKMGFRSAGHISYHYQRSARNGGFNKYIKYSIILSLLSWTRPGWHTMTDDVFLLVKQMESINKHYHHFHNVDTCALICPSVSFEKHFGE